MGWFIILIKWSSHGASCLPFCRPWLLAAVLMLLLWPSGKEGVSQGNILELFVVRKKDAGIHHEGS